MKKGNERKKIKKEKEMTMKRTKRRKGNKWRNKEVVNLGESRRRGGRRKLRKRRRERGRRG